MMIFLAVIILGIFAIILGIIFLALYQPYFLVKFIQNSIPNITFIFPTLNNIFSLTFDDGPNPPHTDQLLDVLDKYEAKATFFFIGSQVNEHPDYIEKCIKRGHQVANHLYTHRPAILLSENQFMESLEKTESLLRQDQNYKMFRPSSGWIRPGLLKIAKNKGYEIVLGSAYVSDTKNVPYWYMLKALKSMLRPGIIIILHDGGEKREKVIWI
jgi:peptidoglycan/xylan/chitin deacetylase (PgdA/CDA1 family)